MTHHNKPCMALRITVLTTKGLVCHSGYQYSQLKSPICHSGYQYSPLRALYVTQGISTHHNRSFMSPRAPVLTIICPECAPVLTTTCLVCHTSITHSTSANLYQPCMSIREQVLRSSTLVCHRGYEFSTGVGRFSMLGWGVRGRGGNLSKPWFVAMRGCHHVFQNYWGAWPSCPLFLCLCFLICQSCMWLVD